MSQVNDEISCQQIFINVENWQLLAFRDCHFFAKWIDKCKYEIFQIFFGKKINTHPIEEKKCKLLIK